MDALYGPRNELRIGGSSPYDSRIVNLRFQLDDLRVFFLAARKSSFAATAIELGTSPAYVSKRIAILEKALGVVLFHRNARRVTVTADGESVYRSAQEIFEGVERMGEAVAMGRREPAGMLRVTSSFRLGTKHIAPALSELALRYPKLDITLDVVDRRVDLLAERVDLDIRVGDIEEPHLVSHRIVRSSYMQPDAEHRAGASAQQIVVQARRLASDDGRDVYMVTNNWEPAELGAPMAHFDRHLEGDERSVDVYVIHPEGGVDHAAR